MTVETQSIFLSPPWSGETARQASRLTMPLEPNRPPSHGHAVQEADQDPQEPPPFRWLRVFPGL